VTGVDALIIAALGEELDAARAAASAPTSGAPGVAHWVEQDADGPTPYLLGEYATNGGGRLSIALARPTHMGGRSIAPIATSLVDRLKPICLAMPGVCAGNPADAAQGDVVVAELAYEHDEGRHTKQAFEGDLRQYPLDVRWVRAAQEFDPTGLPSHGTASEDEAMMWLLARLHLGQEPRDHPARGRYFPEGTWKTRLEAIQARRLIARHGAGWALTAEGKTFILRSLYDDVDGPRRLPFAVLVGPMASGSAVFKDGTIWARQRALGVRKILALDMEAATIATIAHERRVPHWLVVKGVMDPADPTKDDRYKGFAARASAEVLFGLLPRLLPARSTATPTPQPTPSAPSPSVKLDFVRRLADSWRDLADHVGIPAHETRRFSRGDEAREIWEWLDNRRRLSELPDALDAIGRPDLATTLRGAGA
jgi:nucleoside phosphorylase